MSQIIPRFLSNNPVYHANIEHVNKEFPIDTYYETIELSSICEPCSCHLPTNCYEIIGIYLTCDKCISFTFYNIEFNRSIVDIGSRYEHDNTHKNFYKLNVFGGRPIHIGTLKYKNNDIPMDLRLNVDLMDGIKSDDVHIYCTCSYTNNVSKYLPLVMEDIPLHQYIITKIPTKEMCTVLLQTSNKGFNGYLNTLQFAFDDGETSDTQIEYLQLKCNDHPFFNDNIPTIVMDYIHEQLLDKPNDKLHKRYVNINLNNVQKTELTIKINNEKNNYVTLIVIASIYNPIRYHSGNLERMTRDIKPCVYNNTII